MLESISIIVDNFFQWVGSQSPQALMSKYWFLFVITIPRYYILEWVVMGMRIYTRKSRLRKEKIAFKKLHLDFPFVSVIVPGKNEGANIFKLAKSLKEQTFQNFEIVIVSDGSDDYSNVITNSLLNSGYIDRVISLGVRGGKASAANSALYNNNAKYIVHLDADSSLDRDGLEQILMPFYLSDKIKAVGGSIKVRNDRYNFCCRLQALEYIESIMVSRTVASYLGIYRTISGAFGAFDLAVLRSVGAWDIGPGLDGDITQKIRKAGWRVVFNHKAVCLTNVPTTFRALFKQRLRWSKSLVRFRMRKHKDVLSLRSSNFKISNFISNVDNIMYNFVLDYIWLYYLIIILINNTSELLMVIALNFIIMTPIRLVNYAVAMSLSERWRSEIPLVRVVLMVYLYKNIFLRINRIIAGVLEVFFFSSYKDPWNPPKTSFHARIEKQ